MRQRIRWGRAQLFTVCMQACVPEKVLAKYFAIAYYTSILLTVNMSVIDIKTHKIGFTLSRVTKGARLSSCRRFPSRGSPGGPGGKRTLLLYLAVHHQTNVKTNPARTNVLQTSMICLRCVPCSVFRSEDELQCTAA